jgi:hypothetical protein
LRFALAALRVLGALGLGLGLGISSIQVTGVIEPDPSGLLVPIIIYAVIGGGVLVVASPGVGGFLLLGWAAPWLLVLLVAITDFGAWTLFPASVTALYVLALCVSCYRNGHRSPVKSNA